MFRGMTNFGEKYLSGLKTKSFIWLLQANFNKNDDIVC